MLKYMLQVNVNIQRLLKSGNVSNILIGQGENAVFIGLDNGTIINVRYIIKIVVK